MRRWRAAVPAGRPVGRRKWRSRPVSRVLSWTVIPLGPTSPSASSVQPGCGTSRAIAPLLGLAPGGVCRAPRRWPRGRWALTPPFHPCHAPSRAVRRSALCCTFRRLTPPRRYLAPCSMEPGLSSAHCCDATVWPAPPRALWHAGGMGAATAADFEPSLASRWRGQLGAGSPEVEFAGCSRGLRGHTAEHYILRTPTPGSRLEAVHPVQPSPPYSAFRGAPLNSAASFAATDGFRCPASSA